MISDGGETLALMTVPQGEDEVFDVVGVGFGPSNLSLAIALEEGVGQRPGSRPIRAAFLERQEHFGWHRGMLIEGATLQVSFLKDLVTMRDPTSDFSFLAYLHQTGRLAAFINTKDAYPSRVEFHAYLSWAAERLADRVGYGLEVVGASPVLGGDDVDYIDVTARRIADSVLVKYRTRNLVIAAGLEPRLPQVPASPRIWHSSQLLYRLDDVPADQPQTFVVVGAGQSAAEIVDYMHRRFPLAQVHSVFARYGYSPADDTPFVNAIFDPDQVDLFYNAPGNVKDLMHGYHANTNYSVVDTDLIASLHRRAYQELVTGEQRLIMRNLSRVTAVRDTGSAVDIDIEYFPDGQLTTVRADRLVYATGYRPRSPLAMLGEVSSYCKVGPDQAVRLERDHRIVTSERMRCGLYVQGAEEASHGLSATLLSNIATRAGEIACSLAADLDAGPHEPGPQEA